MDINEYRNKGRRRIELPSGLAGHVRQPSVMDMAAYPALMGGGGNGNGEADENAYARDMYHCILRRCFIPDGGAMTEKEPGKCLPGELSIHELTADDAGAVVSAVNEMGKEGQTAGGGARFPAGADQAPRADSCAGENLRPAAAHSRAVHP